MEESNSGSPIRGSADPRYLRSRLARDRPDLLARVVAGELALHTAAVEAGIRPRIRSIRIDSADEAIRALHRVFTVDELRRALDAIDPTPEAAVAFALRAIADAREVMDREPEP